MQIEGPLAAPHARLPAFDLSGEAGPFHKKS
jgi:hypothetical protein